MSSRTIEGFFYGLFMDEEVLSSYNITPRNPRRAVVENFRLHIGKRATLAPSTGSIAYGMVYSLTHAELDSLYSGPGLNTYKAEAVTAVDIDNSDSIVCLCFNLIEAPSAEESNQEYAKKLRAALEKLKFPDEYVLSVN